MEGRRDSNLDVGYDEEVHSEPAQSEGTPSPQGPSTAQFTLQQIRNYVSTRNIIPPGGMQSMSRRDWIRFGSVGVMIVGAIVLIMSPIFQSIAKDYRLKQIKAAVVVDSYSHKDYGKWVTNTQTKTPLYQTFFFYNVVNPQDVVYGQAPIVEEKGPFVFEEKSKKYDVDFFDDGKLVSYTNLYQYTYKGPAKDLDTPITTVDLPYLGATATVGQERNLLRVGSREAFNEIKDQMQTIFIPVLRESSVALAIQSTIDFLKKATTKLGGAADGISTRWGGGCQTYLFQITYCGYTKMNDITNLPGIDKISDVTLLTYILQTGLDQGNAIPAATVNRMLSTTDRLAMLNTERVGIDVRYGISKWLWGNDNTVQEIIQHFSITKDQFLILRAYLFRLYNAPELEKQVIQTYVKSCSQAESNIASADIQSWDDFVWRQWAVGDVISLLSKLPKIESVLPESPPEFAWYGVQAGFMKAANGTVVGSHFSKRQAKCLFDIAQNKPLSYYQSEVLGLPLTSSSTRPQWVDERLKDLDNNQKDNIFAVHEDDIRDCFPSQNEWDRLQGYINYVSNLLVAPEINADVLQKNGGLISTRTVKELLLGFQSPILQLSLPVDDPRAMKYCLLVNDNSLDGPPLCQSSADAENVYNACDLVDSKVDQLADGSKETHRVFYKTRNTYHTGKDDTRKAGALAAYHGDEVVTGVWPHGTVEIKGGARGLSGGVQYGFSMGRQFPPMNSITNQNRLGVFMPYFTMPLEFVYQKDMNLKGVAVKRFVLAPDTFSSSRPDAARFSMDHIQQEGLLNLTDAQVAPMFLSRPHSRGLNNQHFNDIRNYPPFDEERDESFIDIEPITGMAMNAKIQMQLSAKTKGLFDAAYANTYQAEAWPVLTQMASATVSDEDAALFVKQVYGSEKLIQQGTSALAAVGSVLLVLGISVFAYLYWQDKKEAERIRQEVHAPPQNKLDIENTRQAAMA